MNLITTHCRTAKWINDNWYVSDTPNYHWEDSTTRSPHFTELKEALNWIINYDQTTTIPHPSNA